MNYGLVGYSGRMGREIRPLMDEQGHKLVLQVDDDAEKSEGSPELIIDFSLPAAVSKTIALCGRNNTPLVIGTTGLSDVQLELIKELSGKTCVVQSYNFSVGINLILRCIRQLKENTAGWDVEITETHHRFKADKPSGTALMIKKELGREAPISSLRLGGIPGNHTLSFASLGEVITLSHSAQSRRAFAEGAVLAAEFAVKAQPGLYTFEDVMNSM